MEPLRGGRLAKPPEKVARIWANAPVQRTPQEWGLLWVWNHPEVSLVLSGMSQMEHVIENIAVAEHSQPKKLTPDELVLIGKVRDAYLSQGISCTACMYCQPCPNDVNIPRVFSLYNDAMIYGDTTRPRKMYNDTKHFKEERRADKCTECGECLEKCPQQLPIPELLEKAHAFLTQQD
jgi:predicted aldo/keto reductase-like oxidoreductase